MDLQGKVAVITGGAMGIGLATARRLAAEGCAVALWDINQEALGAAATELRSRGAKVFTRFCDVSDRVQVYTAAQETLAHFHRVDILVNNAGYVRGGSILEGTDEEWDKTIAVNLNALVYATRAFLPGMYERNEGHVVNISSAAGLLGVPGLSVYTATKWAVWGLTESLRFEAWNAGKKNVRYSSIHPGYLASGMFEGAKLGWFGNLIIPLVKNHDVIAKAIVESALKKGTYSPKRPWTLNITVRVRGLLPDILFQRALMLFGVPKSMSTFEGRKK